LTDASGAVTFAARYTPWGDTLETYGTGNFAFGYYGGVMDAATGLLYVGNGQYYTAPHSRKIIGIMCVQFSAGVIQPRADS
jgi:hypothetical protein